MATFNPDQSQVNADWTSASKGSDPDTSLGELFKNVGTGVADAAKAGVDLFKNIIRVDATQGVDSIRDREINMGAQQKGFGTQAPKEIDESADRLGTMKAAKESGQIGDSHYFLLLDAEARRLRARYPGFREHIDNVMQDLTGTTPANHAIALMKAELNKEGKDTALNNEMHYARDHGTPGYAEYLKAHNGQPPPLELLRSWNAAHGLNIANVKNETAGLTLEKDRREAEQQKAEKAGTNFLLDNLRLHGQAVSEGSGLIWQKVQELRKTADTAIQSGKSVPADVEANLKYQVSEYIRLRTEEAQRIIFKDKQTNNDGKEYTFASVMGEKGIANAFKVFQLELDGQTKPLLDKDHAAIGSNLARSEAMKNQAVADLMKSNDVMVRMSAMQKLLGPQLLGTLATSDQTFLDEFHQTFHNYVLSGITDGRRTVTDDLKEAESQMRKAGLPTDTIAAVKQTVIENYRKLLTDPRSPPNILDTVVEKLYGTDGRNKDLYSNATLRGKEDLFKKLVSPAATDAVFRLNSPDAEKRYTTWVNDRVGERMLQSASEIRNVIQNRDSGYKIEYNPETLNFTATKTELKTKTPTGGTFGTNPMSGEAVIGKIVNDLNTTINHWTPVADKLKLSKEQQSALIQKNFKEFGIPVDSLQYQGK